MRLFDTHAHLTDPRYDADRDEVVTRAARFDVAVLTAATNPQDAVAAVELARRHAHVYAAVGFYPHDTGDLGESDWDTLARLVDGERESADAQGRPPRIVAVGEIGLDYYRDRVPPPTQRAAFERQLAFARARGLPVLVHCRQAEDDIRSILAGFVEDGGRAVWHCFTTRNEAFADTIDWAAERGVLLGLGGMATWTDAKALRAAIARIPDHLLLLETDAPYLSPRPFAPESPEARALNDWLAEAFDGDGDGQDGAAVDKKADAAAHWARFPAVAKRNEPIGVLAVAAAVAALRGVRPADVARICTRNAREVLGLPPPADDNLARVAYPIRDQLYIALTNRCNNNCGFCARNTSWVVKGHDVRLDHEPDADEVMAAIAAAGGLGAYRELVFCGFGEPTLRIDVLAEVCRRARSGPWRSIPIRVNTNGAGSLDAGRDLVPELADAVDTVSVSLNAADAESYAAMCRPAAGAAAYAEILRFVGACVVAGLKTVCTAVELPGLDVEAVARRAESLGATFRRRAYDQVG